MRWPCSQCPVIAKQTYGHFRGICDGCKKLEEFEVWAERQEMKKLQTIILQKSKKPMIKESNRAE